jgi:hypothetical protein
MRKARNVNSSAALPPYNRSDRYITVARTLDTSTSKSSSNAVIKSYSVLDVNKKNKDIATVRILFHETFAISFVCVPFASFINLETL